MTNQTLDDLTRALTAGVVRNVQRDLSGVHDSDECDCEMCAAAEEYEARQAQGVSKAAHEAKTSPQRPQSPGIISLGTATDLVQSSFPSFDALWSRTPLVIQESTERDLAEYFYLMGCADGREAITMTTNDDLKEMRRLAGERLR